MRWPFGGILGLLDLVFRFCRCLRQLLPKDESLTGADVVDLYLFVLLLS